jgi:hypothetical protein
MMTALPPPDHETLLQWMSAFFDGELEETQERVLFEAMADDLALHEEFLALERTLSALDLSGIADVVMAAVAPAAVSAAGVGLLTSQLLDDEITPEGEARLVSLLRGPAAAEALGLAATASATHALLSALPQTAFVAQQVAALPGRVAAGVLREERAALLYSAALDGELSGAELRELSELAPHVQLEPAFAFFSEAVGLALRAPLADPAGARAGDAAMQAIEAVRLQNPRQPGQRHAVTGPSLAERLRQAFGAAFAPLAFAAAAAMAFVLLDGAPAQKAPAERSRTAPPQWAEAFGPDLRDDDSSSPAELTVLGDNSGTELQALDSGTQVAAVFSTEAHGITVIWVPEPTESGT